VEWECYANHRPLLGNSIVFKGASSVVYRYKHFVILVLFSMVLSCAISFAQATTQSQTIHVLGTVTDYQDAVVPGVKVTFENEQLSRTLTTNSYGIYETDLPPADYVLTAKGLPGFRGYHRPKFHLRSPLTVLNVTLLVGSPCGDMVIGNSDGRPVTKEQIDAATKNCRGEELIPVPSGKGLPLELSIRYGTRSQNGNIYSFLGEKNRWYQTPVFVDYNLFSLRADSVSYDAQKHMIEATGNVIAASGSGTEQHSDTLTVELEDGEATLLSSKKR